MKNQFRKVDIDSPIKNIKIGSKIKYSGQYIKGYEEFTTTVKRIYKEILFVDGKEHKDKYPVPIHCIFDNGKETILGYLDVNGNFKNSFSGEIL